MSPPRPHNMMNLRLTSGWDPLASLKHPCKFQRVSLLNGSVTARHSSGGRQPNFAALNRGRHHLYSAGRPSRWALAHIYSFLFLSDKCAGTQSHFTLPWQNNWTEMNWLAQFSAVQFCRADVNRRLLNDPRILARGSFCDSTHGRSSCL